MLPHKHIIFGFLFSLSLLILFPTIGIFNFLIIFLASFLIDVDHYLYYIFAKRNFSLKKARAWFMERHFQALRLSKSDKLKLRPAPCIFHGIEAIVILFLLSFISEVFAYILLGFVFHQFLDLIDMVYYGFPFHHIGSQTYNIINHKIEK